MQGLLAADKRTIYTACGPTDQNRRGRLCRASICSVTLSQFAQFVLFEQLCLGSHSPRHFALCMHLPLLLAAGSRLARQPV